MTDNEIIKALKKLYDEAHKGYMTHLEHNGPRDVSHEEYIDLISATLDLIQRQQERFDRIVEQLEEMQNIEIRTGKSYCPDADVKNCRFRFSDLSCSFCAFEKAIEIVKGCDFDDR